MNKYILETNPYEEQSGQFFQNLNDFRAFITISAVTLRELPDKQKDFFNKKETFKRPNASTNKMHDNLIELRKLYTAKNSPLKNSKVIDTIDKFIDKVTDQEDFNLILTHYAKNEDHVYFDIRGLLNDIVSGEFDDELAAKEFEEFGKSFLDHYNQTKKQKYPESED